MLLFARSDDVADLKRLIKKKLFEIVRVGRGKYASQAEFYGYSVSNMHGYDYDISTKFIIFYFDSERIYSEDDEEISLADLLLDKYMKTDLIDDEVENILNKRGLKLSDLSELAGYTKPVYHEGESYDSKDYTYTVKKIVKA